MDFKFTNCIAYQVTDLNKAVAYYTEVVGMKLVSKEGIYAELEIGNKNFYLQETTTSPLGPVLDYLTEDLEAAKAHFLKNGCEIVEWRGKGDRCWMRDPQGLVFNVWQN